VAEVSLSRIGRRLLWVAVLAVAAFAVASEWILPEVGAGALLYPARRPMTAPRPGGCEDVEWGNPAVRIRGWRCAAPAAFRGTIVYLHGIADNRASGIGVIQRFRPRGFDVIAYDGRAHGNSGGDTCSYGVLEKADLKRLLDGIRPGPVVLLGTSLGAAVALLEAGEDRRVSAVVAAETFSDLRTVATERAPFGFSRWSIRRAFQVAEERAQFAVDAASPLAAAPSIVCPVLVIHGEADRDTPPSHSQRVFDALRTEKRLIMVPGAGHNGSLTPAVWRQIEQWIDLFVP
jgi:pimeloyl-ACP methyl ester carboxylesterase